MHNLVNPLTETSKGDAEDQNLVRRAKGGSREALEQLVTRHQPWIYNIVLRRIRIRYPRMSS